MEIISNIGIHDLAFQVKVHRESKGYTQQKLVEIINNPIINRSIISHLEQGLRVPDKDKLELICKSIELPNKIWEPYVNDASILRFNFELILSEFVGENINAKKLDNKVIKVLEMEIKQLFKNTLNSEQTRDNFNSIIVYYGIRPITINFFNRYLKEDAFRNTDTLRKAINHFQKDAIRLFSTLQLAYDNFNTENTENFKYLISNLNEINVEHYKNRTDWDKIDLIEEEHLPYLGYIAAKTVEKEEKERRQISDFLIEIASLKEKNELDLNLYTEKKKRKMDSLLRKFESRIENGLFSPLFNPDVETLKKEADYLSPKDEKEIDKIENVQRRAYRNLTKYLTADYMDVYVATSMRSNADFVSVNNFVEKLFIHPDVKSFKLRYFNPTQSWIEDRVAKGMVEALMLKRADICIYMAQMDDTFGKDSEASVSLGQGKPVIVFVPKLVYKKLDIDSEKLGMLNRAELINEIIKINAKEEIDESEDNEALLSRLLSLKFDMMQNEDYYEIIRNHWADFNFEKEVEKRIINEERRKEVKKAYYEIINGMNSKMNDIIKNAFKSIMIAATIRFENRAKTFRNEHPLALQVILSSGVLNGIIVVRSVDLCALLLRNLIKNSLDLELIIDENNYRLIESKTKSTIRVISRHHLVSNSFKTFYKINEQ
jgi:transcriptional regulator with XRE-family HTH domain/predicted transposase YbfD/YdcC